MVARNLVGRLPSPSLLASLLFSAVLSTRPVKTAWRVEGVPGPLPLLRGVAGWAFWAFLGVAGREEG